MLETNDSGLRKPHVTSSVGAKGFTPEHTAIFLDLSGSEMEKKNALRPNTLFNVDEIGLTVVQHKVRKMLAMESPKQVACLPSAQRGAHYRRDIHECFV